MVFNLSGYQSVNVLKAAEGYADIYLPDLNMRTGISQRSFRDARDYPDVALAALSEMLSQKGFLGQL